MKNVFLMILILTFSSNTFAYIDPGTGSLILQGLLAAVATATTVFGIYYGKIKQFFSRKRPEEGPMDSDETPHSQGNPQGERK
ncbi:hypothetical protein [Porticoccus hydrocarbonoclasticus]|uniref:hypothetical protein n=1 Tax=Porticoccus hydrocarbonoclasticus TaxID=1073414 RepID=UPI00055D3FD9|nr:hypothetical protein [Porticoccus hydrocarbonoclasticus]